MADENNQNSQSSKKKHKWIGIILITLLLLFIGFAGYYLERDLEPVPEDQIEDSEIVEEDQVSSEQQSNQEIQQSEEIEQQSEEDKQQSEQQIKENEQAEQQAEQQNGELKTEVQESSNIEKDTQKKKDQEPEIESKENINALEDKNGKADIENGGTETTAKTEKKMESDKTEKKMESEEEIDSSTIKIDREEKIETEGSDKSDKAEDSEEAKKVDQKVEETKNQAAESESKKSSSDQLESEIESENQAESETKAQEKLEQELEDPTLLDRILSILGLADSNFSQDLNILLVGLDDEESVALGSIEADSIILAKLRPKENKLQLKHIDEKMKYEDQKLNEFHDGNLRGAIEKISETELDYHVYVNYQGFEKVIDELGGVKITLEQEVKVPALGLNLKAGDNLLSGKEALNFVRWRGSDSLARFERQKLLINSVLRKLKANNILFNVKELYNTIVNSYNSIETDINPVLAAEIFNYIRETDELELEFIE